MKERTLKRGKNKRKRNNRTKEEKRYFNECKERKLKGRKIKCVMLDKIKEKREHLREENTE